MKNNVQLAWWAAALLAATAPAAQSQTTAPRAAPGASATPASSATAAAAGRTAAPRTPASTTASAAPAAAATNRLQPCVSVVMDPPSTVTLGKSSVIRLNVPVARMVIGGQGSSRAAAPLPVARDERAPASPMSAANASDGVADVDITLLSPTELFFLGKKPGAMNVVLQSADGRCFVRDIIVTIDPGSLQAKLGELMPEETGIKVRGADSAFVLSGQVSDAVKLSEVMSLATSYGDGKKVVNLLRVMSPQQVMLEVKIAEVSKTLLDRFGIDYSRLLTSGGSSRVISGIFGGAPGVFGRFTGGTGAITGAASAGVAGTSAGVAGNLAATASGATFLGIDAQKRDGLIRVLAEPNIMAISGQSASFLSGGRIFIPVAQNRDGGGSTITLEEKEFGVGLKFMPTVLDGTRVNLKLVTEVSELAQTGSAFTTVGGVTSVLPSITSRRVDTTVQLNDGQSFAIAGLIKNNMTESISRFPGLGEVPLIGALFRSTEFQKDQTELIFVVTPRLVKPMVTAISLPTDNHVEPNRADVLFMGVAEGQPKPLPAPTDIAPAPRAANPANPMPATAGVQP